jgi:predicted nucleic acid-binding protein
MNQPPTHLLDVMSFTELLEQDPERVPLEPNVVLGVVGEIAKKWRAHADGAFDGMARLSDFTERGVLSTIDNFSDLEKRRYLEFRSHMGIGHIDALSIAVALERGLVLITTDRRILRLMLELRLTLTCIEHIFTSAD